MPRWRWRSLCLVAAACALAALGYCYLQAVRVPVVVRQAVALPGWPAGAPPLRVALISDIHVVEPDMPATRLRRIVAQVNALAPDLVLIAGDFVSDRDIATRHVPTAEAVAPLSGLRARLGVLAVLGNHDHPDHRGRRSAAEMRAALAGNGVVPVENRAVIRGPVIVAGLGDRWSGEADMPAMLAAVAAARRDGARPAVLLAHNPDSFPQVPRSIALMLAGHTHGGQVVLPLLGPVVTASDYGRRFAYGAIVENGRRLIVTGGLGASSMPLRLNRPPEIVLLTLGPAAALSRR